MTLPKPPEDGEPRKFAGGAYDSDEPIRGSGKITTQFTVWCRLCERHLEIDGTKAECVARFRYVGWKRRDFPKPDGDCARLWICPKHKDTR